VWTVVDTLVTEALAEAGGRVRGVGVASAGPIDLPAGTVSPINITAWQGFPIAERVSTLTGASVRLGGDGLCMAMGERWRGAGRGAECLLGMVVSTGVGGGLVLDGKPWVGRGAAGEIGHVVVRLNGARCPCGRRGCMEAYAGRAAMEAKARREVAKGRKTDLFEIMEERGRERLTSGIWARAAKKEDALALELIDRAIEHLGAGVASACNILDVECVVVGGGLGVRFGEPYVRRIEKAMMPHLFASDHPADVEVASLGDLGGAIGAALLAPAGRRARPVAKAATADGAGG
jgi:glucokinase